jgi:uncharacterized protein (DUF1015 family)
MAIVKSFKGFRPGKDIAEKIASRPYDVLTSAEAREEVKDNHLSFLRVVKPEVDLPEDVNLYSDEVYLKGKENLESLINSGKIFQDEKSCFYIYAQTMWGKTQYGIVGCAAVEDYLNNVIKKHELTRPEKEEDRMNHIRVTNFNAEPVFFTYRDNEEINKIVRNVVEKPAEYNFTLPDGVSHALWVVDDEFEVKELERIFKEEIPYTYVADGHHRTAAAARVGEERKLNNPSHTGNEEYNYFLAVHFPSSQLTIIDYNRVVKDLNGYSKEEFLKELEKNFTIEFIGQREYKPSKMHEMSMYLDGDWYLLRADECIYDDNDPIRCLDVTVLSSAILDPILGIEDLRKSKRIDFVGGIRGLGELKKRVDNGDMKVAFALYPVSMEQLIRIADTGNIMPPKTTWFEPKLRSGLILHCLD